MLKIKGARKLEKKLRALPRRVQGQVMRKALKDALVPVMELAKKRVPVDSGRLQKSIKIANLRKRGVTGAVVQTGTRKQLRITADNAYYYPAAIEYGSPGRNVAPKSFLRASLFLRRRQALGIVRTRIRQMIR